jgi:hypothetical protein
MRFALIPVIAVRPPYPLGKALFPEDVLRGPVRRLHHGSAITHQLQGNPPSRESFRDPEQIEMRAFAGAGNPTRRVFRIQPAEDVGNRVDPQALDRQRCDPDPLR